MQPSTSDGPTTAASRRPWRQTYHGATSTTGTFWRSPAGYTSACAGAPAGTESPSRTSATAVGASTAASVRGRFRRR
eukprot:5144157-Lingulodinium_polyedra.AAC.1